ncbi:5375_t:CDS:2, partial [Acaulospora colombiana]
DMEALNAIFIPASSANEVIPDVKDKSYVASTNLKLDIRQLKGISNSKVQTFLTKLNDVVVNGVQVVGTDKTFTDTYVDDLLRIAKLNNFLLRIRNQPPRKLYIQDVAKVISVPDFVIEKKNNQNRNIVVIEDKHLKNIGSVNGFGETQIAVDILSCGSKNIRSIGGEEYTDQTLWAVFNDGSKMAGWEWFKDWFQFRSTERKTRSVYS